MKDIVTDGWWLPEKMAERLPRLKVRNAVRDAIRSFFTERNFLEVDTAALQTSPGLEPHLSAFETEQMLPGRAGSAGRLYLHTSPEFAMKKLLAGGLERIWQLCHVFRNAEGSSAHHCEFSMIEWYRAGEDYRTLMDDSIALVRAAAMAAGTPVLEWKGQACDPFAPWQILTVAEAFRLYAEIDLMATYEDAPLSPRRDRLADEAGRIGIRTDDGDRWDDIFFRIFLERIEPELGQETPTILCEYPVSMAALSRPKPDEPLVCERFEIYACGLELANAFGELTDPDIQLARFEADMDLKQTLYGERYPIDGEFIAALRHGLPQSSGIALGFDRLVMLVTGAEDIRDILWSPIGHATG